MSMLRNYPLLQALTAKVDSRTTISKWCRTLVRPGHQPSSCVQATAEATLYRRLSLRRLWSSWPSVQQPFGPTHRKLDVTKNPQGRESPAARADRRPVLYFRVLGLDSGVRTLTTGQLLGGVRHNSMVHHTSFLPLGATAKPDDEL